MWLQPVDESIADAFTSIDRSVMRDPWDRFSVATALALGIPLVSHDELIIHSGLVETIW
jgi:PIN domain nuclease of toxin-antitoxin system